MRVASNLLVPGGVDLRDLDLLARSSGGERSVSYDGIRVGNALDMRLRGCYDTARGERLQGNAAATSLFPLL